MKAILRSAVLAVLAAAAASAQARPLLVSATTDHSAMIRSDGSAWAWGYASYGLGDGVTTYSQTPVRVAGIDGAPYLTNAVSVVVTSLQQIVLLADGTVVTWGNNHWGSLGDGTTLNRLVPARVKSPDGAGILSNIVAISAADGTCAAVSANGKVYTWGYGVNGQLGIGVYGVPPGATSSQYYYGRALPVEVRMEDGSPLARIVDVAVGGNTMTALAQDGTVYSWGSVGPCETQGVCPTGFGSSSGYPALVKGPGGTGVLTGVKAVASGAASNYALRSDGAVFAWGNNDNGQLGDGTTTSSLYPVAVGGGATSEVTEIASGGWTAYARRSDGSVVAWGYNAGAELGMGVNNPHVQPNPQFVRTSSANLLTGAIAIFSGFWSQTAFAVTGDGVVNGWGQNGYCLTGACGGSVKFYATPGLSRLP